jgi:hypothetical protein
MPESKQAPDSEAATLRAEIGALSRRLEQLEQDQASTVARPATDSATTPAAARPEN